MPYESNNEEEVLGNCSRRKSRGKVDNERLGMKLYQALSELNIQKFAIK